MVCFVQTISIQAKSRIMAAVSSREIFMRRTSFSMGLAAFSWLVMVTGTAQASEETQLVQSINSYRSQAQPCANVVSQELPP